MPFWRCRNELLSAVNLAAKMAPIRLPFFSGKLSCHRIVRPFN